MKNHQLFRATFYDKLQLFPQYDKEQHRLRVAKDICTGNITEYIGSQHNRVGKRSNEPEHITKAP